MKRKRATFADIVRELGDPPEPWLPGVPDPVETCGLLDPQGHSWSLATEHIPLKRAAQLAVEADLLATSSYPVGCALEWVPPAERAAFWAEIAPRYDADREAEGIPLGELIYRGHEFLRPGGRLLYIERWCS